MILLRSKRLSRLMFSDSSTVFVFFLRFFSGDKGGISSDALDDFRLAVLLGGFSS